MAEARSLSIFFPCYNDAGTIENLVLRADRVAREVAEDYEVLVIDDGSTDGSRALLSGLGGRVARLRVVFHEENRGYGGALQSGFAHAGKDLVFYTDGDGQYDVNELHGLLAALGPGVDVVNGFKRARSDPWFRVLIGEGYRRAMRLLFRLPVRDVDCDFRLIRRQALERVRLRHTSGVICVELVKKLEFAGCRFAEVPVHHYARTYGRSQFFRWRRLADTACGLGRLWWEVMVRRNPGRG